MRQAWENIFDCVIDVLKLFKEHPIAAVVLILMFIVISKYGSGVDISTME